MKNHQKLLAPHADWPVGRAPFLALTLGLAVLASGCSDDDDDGDSGGGPATVEGTTAVVVGSTPDPDFASVETTIDSIVFVDSQGNATPNLTDREVTIDLMRVDQQAAWLAAVKPPAGEYEMVQLRVRAVRARLEDGSDAGVTISSETLGATLADPLVLTSSDMRVVQIDWDVVESFEDSSGPTLTFTPFGTAFVAADPVTVDELQGVVIDARPASSVFTIDAFADGDRTVDLGEIDVLVQDDTLLVDDRGLVFASEADFFEQIQLGSSEVEVHGTLVGDGRVEADRVELSTIPSTGAPVVIVGRVLFVDDDDSGSEEVIIGTQNVGPVGTGGDDGGSAGGGTDPEAGQFVLLIEGIPSGSEVAQPVLDSIGDPSSIDVAWNQGTLFFVGNQIVSAAELRAGQDVRVQFELFDEPPFLASQVEIQRLTASFEGVIVDDSGRPDSIVVDVSGQSGADDVLVPLDGAELCLDIQGGPELDPFHLVSGMRVRVDGAMNPAGDELDATKITVHHGHLIKANVSGVDAGNASFTTSSSQIVQTFGDLITDGPLTVEIDPQAIFKQDARDLESFFQLFQNLQSDETLEVKVKGVGSGDADRVVAFEVKAKVRRGRG